MKTSLRPSPLSNAAARSHVSPASGARRITLRETTGVSALEQVKAALGQEGLAVLDVIDLRDALERRTDRDIGPYWLVQFFQPELAARELSIDGAAGLAVRHELAVWQEGRDAMVASTRATEAAEAVPGSVENRVANAMGRLVL